MDKFNLWNMYRGESMKQNILAAKGLCKPSKQLFIIEEPSDELLDALKGETVVAVTGTKNKRADMVNIMQNGKLVVSGTPKEMSQKFGI